MSIIKNLRELYRAKKIEMIEIFLSLILLILSVPVFIFYNLFPTISPEIGPHQIASWLSVTLAFIGFGTLIYNMGKLEI